jgi:hypothetical protein
LNDREVVITHTQYNMRRQFAFMKITGLFISRKQPG